MQYDAVVLAGGRATRLGGADKAALELGSQSLLDRTLSAVSSARQVVVVGDERPTSRAVLWTREHPPYGGPVAATYAGLDALRAGTPGPADLVLVLAVDMPGVTEASVERLVAAVPGSESGIHAYDGAVLAQGGRRHLAMAVTADALERVRPDPVAGAAMRQLWASLGLVDVPATPEEAADVDEWADIGRLPPT